jgi:hypothetical protein
MFRPAKAEKNADPPIQEKEQYGQFLRITLNQFPNKIYEA